MAYDPALGHTVLFGGQLYDPTQRDASGSTVLNDTWSYDGRTWTKLLPPNAPPPGIDGPMVFDDSLNSLMLYGVLGQQAPGTDSLAQTWTYGRE